MAERDRREKEGGSEKWKRGKGDKRGGKVRREREERWV